MKRLILAAAVSFLLSACGDSPRGPLEVDGKKFIERSTPMMLEFTSRKEGIAINLEDPDQIVPFSYKLEGEELVLSLSKDERVETVTLNLSNDRYKGENGESFSEFTEQDLKRVARIQERAKQALIEKAEREKAEKEKALKEALAKKMLSTAGAPKDASEYLDIAEFDDDAKGWSEWFLAAKGIGRSLDDDEKLRVFSEKWNRTSDTFERHNMREAELARINKKLSDLKDVEYIVLSSDSARTKTGLEPRIQYTDSYNFDTKSFRLTDGLCSDKYYSSNNGRLSYMGSEALCTLPIADEELAKKVEALRSKSRLEIHQNTYLKAVKLPDDKNILTLVPVAVDYKLSETPKWNQPNKVFATIKLRTNS